MTRKEEIRNAIELIFPIPPFEKGRKYEQALMATGFEGGVKWADEHPKSPWISVKDDLPCNHKELIDEDGDSQITKVIIVRYKDNSVAFARMAKHEGQWKFLGRVTHWMPIPKLSK